MNPCFQMSSSSSDENDTTIHRSTNGALYAQSRAGSSKRHDGSEGEDDEEHYARFQEENVSALGQKYLSISHFRKLI